MPNLLTQLPSTVEHKHQFLEQVSHRQWRLQQLHHLPLHTKQIKWLLLPGLSGSSIARNSITSGYGGCYCRGLSGIGRGLGDCNCREDADTEARRKELTRRNRERARVAAKREACRLRANKSGHAQEREQYTSLVAYKHRRQQVRSRAVAEQVSYHWSGGGGWPLRNLMPVL